MITSAALVGAMFWASMWDPDTNVMHGIKAEMSSMPACRALEERFKYAHASGQFGNLELYETSCEEVEKEETL